MTLCVRFDAAGPVSFGLGMGLACALGCVWARPMGAQQLIGYVSTREANVTGASDVVDGRAVLTGAASVTAKDHTAPITLGRGGTVRVCQTSELHVTEARTAETASPLLFSLDHGAIEIEMAATASDAVMTPDLRLAVRGKGPLDLRLRVAHNGDTCVENRGAGAPAIGVSDPFGEAVYEVMPGQHVLFEHGSVHEVVDHESSPCGCPDAGMSVAEALLASGGGDGAAGAGSQASASEKHPFPAAVSEGLAPAAEVPQAPAGEAHAQVSDGLSYNAPAAEVAGGGTAEAGQKAQIATGAPAKAEGAKPAAAPKRDVVHVVGRFFRRLFGHA